MDRQYLILQRKIAILKYIFNILRFIYSIYAFVCFVLIMLILFPFIIVASFFGKMKGGDFIYKLCLIWSDVWFLLIGVSHKNIYEAKRNISHPYIFVSNHISYFDVPVLIKAVGRQRIRVLGKSELGKIPIFGSIYKRAVVMVDRKDAQHRAKSVNTLKSILKRNVSVFIFPEGTFNETGEPLKFFYDGAFKIAIEMQIPIKPILLLDTYDRLNYKSIFSLTPGRSRAVFLEETATAGLLPGDVSFLKEKVFKQMQEALISYNATWIKSQAKKIILQRET